MHWRFYQGRAKEAGGSKLGYRSQGLMVVHSRGRGWKRKWRSEGKWTQVDKMCMRQGRQSVERGICGLKDPGKRAGIIDPGSNGEL